MKNKIFAAFIILSLVLTGCTTGTDPAGEVVEQYLSAMVDQQAETLVTLVCPDWESRALLEMDSFSAVAPELKDVSCAEAGTEGEVTLVACTGMIATTYNNEKSEVSLVDWTYEVIQQNGTWLVCGYR